MASRSLQHWRTQRTHELDQIEAAHTAIGGTGSGRRYATSQVNQAYAMLLSSHFQGFCRDLHSECLDNLVRAITPQSIQLTLRAEFLLHRRLDQANPNPGNIGADFNRFGLRFWPEVITCDRRNARRRDYLENLNVWRNAIAHQDFDPDKLGGKKTPQLGMVRTWRKACDGLTEAFDSVIRSYLFSILGHSPW